MGLDSRIVLSGGFFHEILPLRAGGKFGESPLPTLSFTTEDGTGSGQANFVFVQALSVGAGATVLYDMKGGGGELDVMNLAMAATAVKFVALKITTPGASTSLRFGPQNQTDAAQLWFSGVGSTAYETVLDGIAKWDARAGWAIGSGTKKLAVNNPGAATVAGTLVVIGTK